MFHGLREKVGSMVWGNRQIPWLERIAKFQDLWRTQVWSKEEENKVGYNSDGLGQRKDMLGMCWDREKTPWKGLKRFEND